MLFYVLHLHCHIIPFFVKHVPYVKISLCAYQTRICPVELQLVAKVHLKTPFDLAPLIIWDPI